MRNTDKTLQIIFMTSVLTLAISVLPFSATKSDGILEGNSGIRIQSATATPAQLGENTKIRFRMINDSPADLHIIDIETPISNNVRLIADVGEGRYTELASIGVESEDTLDFTTSHLFYKAGPINTSLESGGNFDIILHLSGDKRINVSVHVHHP